MIRTEPKLCKYPNNCLCFVDVILMIIAGVTTLILCLNRDNIKQTAAEFKTLKRICLNLCI